MAFDTIFPDGTRVRTYSDGTGARHVPLPSGGVLVSMPRAWWLFGVPAHVEAEDIELARLEGMYRAARRERAFLRVLFGASAAYWHGAEPDEPMLVSAKPVK